MQRAFKASLVAIGMMALGGTAQANVLTSFLDLTGIGGTLPLTPYGEVVVTDVGSGSGAYADVQVTIFNGGFFVNTGNHTPFVYSLDDATDIGVTPTNFNLTPALGAWGFAQGTPAFTDPGYTPPNFTNGIALQYLAVVQCTTKNSNPCTGGQTTGTQTQPQEDQGASGPTHPSFLEFHLDGVTTADFTTNTGNTGPGNNFYFAADIMLCNTGLTGCSTGAVASDSITTETNQGTVPEASTWVMMMVGFAVLGFFSYGRARKSGRLLRVA